jgi:hypothetical protein
LVDLDADGKPDILSGSWPGELYVFKGSGQGAFAAGEKLRQPGGKPIILGRASTVFAADWDGDGDHDLVIGTITGEVHLVRNDGTSREPRFVHDGSLESEGKPIRIDGGDTGPVVADWDSDGKPDLIVGGGDGSVVWFRNVGTAKEPRLAGALALVPPSTLRWSDDLHARPGQWGMRAKVCIADWDCDGRLDLLLGDLCGGHLGKPQETEDEKREELHARDELPRLKEKWEATYHEYRALRQAIASSPGPDPEDTKKAEGLHAEMKRLKEVIVAVQKIQQRYRPQFQYHGFVWLFRRTAP